MVHYESIKLELQRRPIRWCHWRCDEVMFSILTVEYTVYLLSVFIRVGINCSDKTNNKSQNVVVSSFVLRGFPPFCVVKWEEICRSHTNQCPLRGCGISRTTSHKGLWGSVICCLCGSRTQLWGVSSVVFVVLSEPHVVVCVRLRTGSVYWCVYYESIKRKLKIRCIWVSVWWKTTN